MRTLILATACIALGGCALFQSGTQADLALKLTEAEACGVVGVSLSGVAPFRKSGRLAADDAQVIDAQVLPLTDPVCTAPTPPSATALASQALSGAAGKIATIAAKYAARK